MNALLTRAIAAASKLPDEEQNALAQLILARLEAEDDERWDATFDDPRSEDFLERLAAETRDDIARGRTTDGDPSSR